MSFQNSSLERVVCIITYYLTQWTNKDWICDLFKFTMYTIDLCLKLVWKHSFDIFFLDTRKISFLYIYCNTTLNFITHFIINVVFSTKYRIQKYTFIYTWERKLICIWNTKCPVGYLHMNYKHSSWLYLPITKYDKLSCWQSVRCLAK